MTYLSNPALPTILPDWQGVPLDDEGRFFNPEYPFELSWRDILKWKYSHNRYEKQKKKDLWRARVVRDDSFLKNTRNLALWLGHASFFFRLNGLRILIDPVFGKLSPFMPRFSDLPVDPGAFQRIDLVLLTHDHRDHCDKDSLRFLLKNNPRAKVVAGLGMRPLLKGWSNGSPIVEMGWFQQFEDESAGLKITYLPTRHWGRRWLTDTNRRLWGAFLLQTDRLALYFGGDSGYGAHYSQTAALCPHIDYAWLGIGAFAPEWFMHSNHTSPLDAWKAFHDLKAERMSPMHYGTFDLSDEPLGEPERLIRKIAHSSNDGARVNIMTIGEAMPLSQEPAS